MNQKVALLIGFLFCSCGDTLQTGGESTFISRPAWAPHHSLPFKKLRFRFGAEVVEERERFAVVVLELLEETFRWWGG